MARGRAAKRSPWRPKRGLAAVFAPIGAADGRPPIYHFLINVLDLVASSFLDFFKPFTFLAMDFLLAFICPLGGSYVE